MYYPEEVIRQVIDANNIVDVIGGYVHLKKSGSSYMGLCPFHNEKTPSFSVSPGKQVFHCFGCGEGGNVITFLMKYENMTFQEALKSLADRAGIKLPEENYSEKAREKARQRDTLLSINKETATYYYRLLRSPVGRAGLSYLEGRKLTPEIMSRFGLGFADGARSDLVAMLRKRGFKDEDILASGVAVFDEKRGLHDKFWNRVIYPIMDLSNRVIGFGGRVMGEGKPKYLNSPETPVFDKSRNLYGLNIARRSKAPYFILCEGYMDVISMHQAGFDMAVASLGTAFTEQQAQILKRFNRQILLDYDSDGAGVKAALRNMQILRSAGITPKVVNMRPAKDADEFMKTYGPGEFQKRLDNAENAFMYDIRMAQDSYDMDDPDQRTAFYHLIAQKLCSFTDEIERNNYISAMSRTYLIPEDVLKREVASYNLAGAEAVHMQAQVRSERKKEAETDASGKRLTAVESAQKKNQRLLLTWLSDEPSLYPKVRQYITPEDFDEGLYREAAGAYFHLLEKDFGDALNVESGSPSAGNAAPASVIASFDTEEEQKEAASLFETRIPGLDDKNEKEKALRDVIYNVKKNSLDRNTQMNDLTAVIAGKRLLQSIAKENFTV
ncbi:MAG: DNA primase [Lachnospiraceae bacterium]|nr:DNA primase [Lachnospiraceae bacterium]